MKSKSLTSTANIDCKTCQANLADYVRLELTGQAAEQTYPEVAFHVETCARCEAVYYREFHSQGQRKSLAELQQIGQRSQVAAVMSQIVPVAGAGPVPLPDPNWYELALDQGRIWFERETGHWRQLWLSLASLGNTLTLGGSPQAPALTGLMGAESPSTSVLGAIDIAPPDSDFEIRLVVVADPTSTDEELCQVNIAISLKDRFGDFSGLEVTLLWGNSAHRQETDALGRVSFTSLPRQQLTSMSLIVSLVAN